MNLNYQTLKPWLGGLAIIAMLALLWQPVSQWGGDMTMLRQWRDQLGWLAPLAFFALNVAQIVVAPIPGYPVQVMGGVLFGVTIGSLCAVGGMVTGGVLAAWLGRHWGRPWLAERLGDEALTHWEDVAHINSFWTWWLILLIPLGDIPYFLAGLSTLRLRYFALAILLSRGPFTVLIVWLGDRAVTLPLTWLALFMALIGLIVMLGFSQRRRLETWARALLQQPSEI